MHLWSLIKVVRYFVFPTLKFKSQTYSISRTIHSIIDRTPDVLLSEIILIDDFSDLRHLGPKLEKYVSKHFDSRVKLIRLNQRHGLIKARLVGIYQSVSEILGKFF